MTQSTNPILDGADFGNQSQDDPNGGYEITVVSGEENLSADFGYNWNPDPDVNGNDGQAALGDRIWVDADSDGSPGPR